MDLNTSTTAASLVPMSQVSQLPRQPLILQMSRNRYTNSTCPNCPKCLNGPDSPTSHLKNVSRLVAAGLARLSMSEAAKVIRISAAVVRVIEELRPMGVVR